MKTTMFLILHKIQLISSSVCKTLLLIWTSNSQVHSFRLFDLKQTADTVLSLCQLSGEIQLPTVYLSLLTDWSLMRVLCGWDDMDQSPWKYLLSAIYNSNENFHNLQFHIIILANITKVFLFRGKSLSPFIFCQALFPWLWMSLSNCALRLWPDRKNAYFSVWKNI